MVHRIGGFAKEMVMFSTRKSWTWVMVFSLLLSAEAVGQTSRGGISGTVEDKSGAVVPDANVQIEQRGTGLKLSAPTTGGGIFSFVDLPVGFYTVTVSHPGFQTQKINDLEVQVGRISSLTVTLDVAQANETVEVAAATATIETSESALNAVVGARSIQEIPLNGRDYRQLLQLTPGFNQASSMNGNRPNQNNWQIDGVDNNDFWHNSEAVNQGSISGIAGVLLPIDAIEEFNQQSIGSADYGRNPGSMVNVAIKTGTNDFHGSLYYFHRNDAFAKASPFTDYGKLRNHNYGGSIGGPIWKDKAFFFFTFEAQRFIAGNSQLATVPSNAWVARAEARLSARGIAPNPVMVSLLGALWPSVIKSAPATTDNFSSHANNNYRSNNGVARVDYSFNDKERLFVRGIVGSGDATAFAGSVYQDYFQAVPSRQQNWAAVLNSTFSVRLTNQFLFGVNYFLQNFDDSNHTQDVVALGFNTGATSASLGAPNIELNGFNNGGVGETPNLGRTDTTWHLTDDLSYTFGRHALKFGGEFRRAKLFVHYLRDMRGLFLFDGSAVTAVNPGVAWGGNQEENSLADFLAGYIGKENGTIATGDPRRDYYVNSFSWHAQDSWQVTPRFNFNYGLRWDYNGPMYEPKHTISTFLPSAPNGLAFPPQTLDRLYPRDLNNFAPRLGFAFTPTRGGKTVIRGAWGIYYDVPNGNLIIDNRASPGGRGVARNPGGSNPVFSVTNQAPISVVQGQPIFGSSTPQPPFGVYGINQNLRSPYVQNFSLNVQHQLTPRIVAQAGYVGSQGRKLIVTRNINQPAPSVTTPNPNPKPFASQFPNFSGITQISSAANSQFNSMQLSVRATSWHGLSAQLAYTLGHARDEFSFARNNRPTDNFNLKADYGNADFDTRHNVSANLIYDVPQLGHSLPRLTNGWELASLWAYNSGFPFTVYAQTGSDNSHTGNKKDRADLIGNPFSGVVQPAGGISQGVQWINPAAFPKQCPTCNPVSYANAPGTFGNSKRNQFYGPHFKTMDFSVIKNTPITERVKTQFRVEMFNLFNVLNLAQPGGNALGGPSSMCVCDGGSFGLLSGTVHSGDAPGIGGGEPFNVQFALKIIF